MKKKIKREVAIIHFNTPELTEAAIMSVRKHGGEDYHFTILDNSNLRPFVKRMKGVKVIDNTQGQIIDFDEEFANLPRVDKIGVAKGCDYGSVRHMMSVQALWDILPDGFLLMDPDILLRRNIDFMFCEDMCAVGHILKGAKARNPFLIDRLIPFLCWINVPMCRAHGINYYDPNRSWGVVSSNARDKRNWYDTGASFLEDIRRTGLYKQGRRIDIRPLMVHLGGGSWKNNDMKTHSRFLAENRELWEPEKKKKSSKPEKP